MDKRIPRSLAGSKPRVTEAAQAIAQDESKPFLAQRIYSPSAGSQDAHAFDPRYPDKQNQVDNIYHKPHAPQEQPKRSGVMQILNWLAHGRFE